MTGPAVDSAARPVDGPVDVPAGGPAQYDADYVNLQILPRTLTGRLGEHEEIAAAMVFLADDASSYITGITLPVEGGLLTS